MPKISAPTVAEHRERVIAAIVAGTREVLIDKGYADLKLGEVAAKAKVSRTSIYDYFVNKDDVILAVLEQDIPTWEAAVKAGVEGVTSPRGRVEAYIEALMGIATDGGMELAAALRQSNLSKFVIKSLTEMVQDLIAPLAAALKDLGDENPDVTAMMILRIVDSAIWQIEKGYSKADVTKMAVSLILDGVDRE
ncbi:MAG: hypothetical protein DCC49_05435 [Acidobacteria bacterium]|nr:MAG: hypothetical protein DCC49_05435 [Acidobacteriota bacterium]